ncbi:quinoprotein relay system zinc metallohydrolase 1 [Sphingomonas kaistensis]|uniref:Quinoprotein relay system zinc metallohydrolase 1 n=1 Tax=Sphingomonas kaistensis TaxID=298708 RepID=A0ABZ2G6S0_9SPHN
MIRRRAFLGGALAAVAAPPALAQPFGYRIRPEPVGDGIWIVRGADEPIASSNGGAIANLAIIATDAGAVVVDAGPSLRYGTELKAVAARLGGGTVARVYLTHFHPDHDYGAAAFDPAIVAATRQFRDLPLTEHQGFADGMYRLLGDWMRGTEFNLPGRTAAAGVETIGGRPLRLLPLGGHSASDLVIMDEKSGVLIAGDLVFNGRAASTPHADVARWKQSLATLRALPHRSVLPGHGPFDPTPTLAIDQTEAWIDWVQENLRGSLAAGLDMVEAGNVPIPARFASLKAARYELQRSVAHFYPALEATQLPRVDAR